jgi:enediyne biosynthesis protein E4
MRVTTLLLAMAGLMTSALAENAVTVPRFVDETKSSGVASVYAGAWEFMVGGGVATFDCNADGFTDMLLAGGKNPSTFYRNVSQQGGKLTFTAEKSGLEFENVTGGYGLDVDSDGIADVVLLRVGENLVMRGKGNCQFERANEAWNFAGGDGWSTAFAATFERGATWPSLAVGNYINRSEEISPWGSCTENWLHRPGAAGNNFAAPLPLTPSFCPLSMLFTDWNRSGTPSLRVSNDREYYEGGQEQLWKIPPGQAPQLYAEKEGWKYLRIWGMGIANYDVDHDGYSDYFLTSMADQKLQTLATPAAGAQLQPTYKDVAYAKGVTAHRPFMGDDLRPSTGWHAQFEDVNNDGRIDLFVAKGNVWEMPDFAMQDPNNLLVQAEDGKFVEMADKAGVASVLQSRGAAVTDFNMDGLVDLVVVNRNGPAEVWRNATPSAGSWIGLKLQQQGTNRDGLGAWIEAKWGDKILRREITSGGGHVSGGIRWWHFGLGNQTTTEVRVLWPDGVAGDWQALKAGEFYTLRRDQPALPWRRK